MPPLRGEEWLCDMSPSSSGWLASANKPLSFTSAPASQVLAFVEAGSWTWVQLQNDLSEACESAPGNTDPSGAGGSIWSLESGQSLLDAVKRGPRAASGMPGSHAYLPLQCQPPLFWPHFNQVSKA